MKSTAFLLIFLQCAWMSPCVAAKEIPLPAATPADQREINEILNSTVTSTANQTPPPSLGNLAVPELPPQITDHSKNKTINLGPLHMGPLIQIASLRPIKLDAQYTQPITLSQALSYALRNSLPIAINKNVYASQYYQFWGSVGGFLPSIGTRWSYTHSHVFPDTEINSRIFQENMSFPVFQGGAVMYGMLNQLYRTRASRQQYFTSINDVLLNTYKAYYNLLLQRALLQIRIKSVEVSEAQLKLNTQLYVAGTGTRFAVMQSRTQLALDRQALLQQQVGVRLASIELGFTINAPLAMNLVPVEDHVTEDSLVDQAMNIEDLLNITLTHRPELFQFDYLRMAAARNVQVAASSLYPQAQWNITAQHSSTTVHGGNGGGGGTSLGALASAAAGAGGFSGFGIGSGPAVGVTTAGVPVINGTPLQIPQIAPGTGGISVTPGSTNVTFGTATAATTTGGGGSTVVTGGAGNLGASSFSPGSTSVTGVSAIGAFGGRFNAVTSSFNINQSLSNLGVSQVASILQARTGERQTVLQANQVLQVVNQQVRPSYLNMLVAREQIDVTAAGVASSAEELRLANLRVQMGVGTNLELIQAQRDYITALINQAQAIIASNQAQAQLLHDTGVISFDTLTNGYKYR
ncbi:MAG TPA: TolC family protein [Candidatus Obscuribacterales bacterium]